MLIKDRCNVFLVVLLTVEIINKKSAAGSIKDRFT